MRTIIIIVVVVLVVLFLLDFLRAAADAEPQADTAFPRWT